MKTTAHTIISTATGLGLAVFTIASFLIAGPAAPATLLGFSFLAVYGMSEMAMIEYTPLGARRPARRNPGQATPRAAGHTTVPAIVEFERPASRRCAA